MLSVLGDMQPCFSASSLHTEQQWILNENQQAERGNADADADCHQFPICSYEEKKRALFAYLIIA